MLVIAFRRSCWIVDETWVLWCTQSKPWTSPNECAPKKAKTVLSAEKLMLTVFWDSQGMICIRYVGRGKMVKGHTSTAVAKLVEFGYELLIHPPYSVRLFLFPNFEKSLARQKFESKRRSSLSRRPTLQNSRKSFFQTG